MTSEILHYAILEKLLLTFAMTLAYGIFKQSQNKPVGFGTYSYVAVGSCALSYTAFSIGRTPETLLASIITGIGFLGAGALIKTGGKVSGFSSAAGIWLTAILGMNIGLGEYKVGFVLYGFIWAIVIIDWYLDREKIGMYQRKVSLVTRELLSLNDAKKIFKLSKIRLISQGYHVQEELYSLEFVAKLKDKTLHHAIHQLKQEKIMVEFTAEEQ